MDADREACESASQTGGAQNATTVTNRRKGRRRITVIIGAAISIFLVAIFAVKTALSPKNTVATIYQSKKSTAEEAPPEAKAALRSMAVDNMRKGAEALEAFRLDPTRKDKLKEALARSQTAVDLDPSDNKAWRFVALAHRPLWDEPVAMALSEDALEKALAITPGDEISRLILARLLADRGAFSKALGHLEKATMDNTTLFSTEMCADMTRMYIADRMAKRGAEFFRKALEKRPKFVQIRVALAILTRETGDKETALELARETARAGEPPTGKRTISTVHAAELVKRWEEQK